VYVTVAGAHVTLVSVWFIVLPLLPEKPVIELAGDSTAVQVYVTVFEGVMVVPKVIFVVELLQIVRAEGVAVAVGVGLTVTTKVDEGPWHFKGSGPIGIITYVTTPVVVPEFTKISEMVAVVPDGENPVKVPNVGEVVTEAVHV
jgi:hypothetical protein